MMIRKFIQSTFQLFGYELRKKKKLEEVDDPYHALSLFLDQKKTNIVIDAGASVGDITNRLSAIFPNATVHAIEPYPPFYECLEQISLRNNRIRPAKLALSEENGSAFLQVNQSEGTNSLLEANVSGKEIYGDILSPKGRVKIECQKLDDFMNERSIDHVDFLKFDLQGSELPALKGGSRAFQSGNIKFILCEIMIHNHYHNQPSAIEILRQLTQVYDYKLLNFYQPVYHHGYLLQVDALLVHSSVKESVIKKARYTFFPHSPFPIN